jgi:hypothetical protein
MEKYIIIKLETQEFAKTYDDIKPDKYLSTFKLEYSPYPYKTWTSFIENAIAFFEEEDAKKVCDLLRINTPYPLKVEKFNL